MRTRPLQYKDLTAEQANFFVTYVYNRVRLREFPTHISKFTFEDQNLIHDFEYWRGGTEKDRRRADRRFLFGCLSTTIKRISSKYWLRFGFGILCHYLVIRAFGKFSFCYSENPATTWKEFVTRCETISIDC